MQKILLISESENKDTAMKTIGSDVNYEIIHRTSLDENIIKCCDNELIIIFSDENSLHMQAVSAADEQQLIIRAKCTLIQYLKLTEPQAHKYIEKQSMDLRKTKLEIAQRILKTYEM